MPVPVLSPRLSSLWVGLVTPIPAELAWPLIDSLVNEVVVRDHSISTVVPHAPIGCRDAIALALRHVADLDVSTRWTDAELYGRSPADPIPTDPDWAGATVFADAQRLRTDAPPSAVFAEVTSLGGDRGWLVGNALWMIRGWIDLVTVGSGCAGGAGTRPTCASATSSTSGASRRSSRPNCSACAVEMRLPGDAWLEWSIHPSPDGTEVIQRALFRPRGLFGRAYWYAVAPFHRFIFRPLARRIVDLAEARTPA